MFEWSARMLTGLWRRQETIEDVTLFLGLGLLITDVPYLSLSGQDINPIVSVVLIRVERSALACWLTFIAS